MENLKNEIVTLVIENNIIQIRYDNDNKEEIEINELFYSDMRKLWLISQPPFISDRYKNVMNVKSK